MGHTDERERRQYQQEGGDRPWLRTNVRVFKSSAPGPAIPHNLASHRDLNMTGGGVTDRLRVAAPDSCFKSKTNGCVFGVRSRIDHVNQAVVSIGTSVGEMPVIAADLDT